MSERWVLNASPLIVLARVGQAHLFQELTEEVIVPRSVVTELNAGPEDDVAVRFLREGHLPIVDAPNPPASLLAWDLGAGETAVLAYALAHPGWTAVLDDRAARKCAQTFSIPLKGTLAVVILARKKGLIPSASAVLRQMQTNGFRLKDDLIQETLRQTVGETW